MQEIQALLECFLLPGYNKVEDEETFSEFAMSVQGRVAQPLALEAVNLVVTGLPFASWTITIALEGQESPHSLGYGGTNYLGQFLDGVNYGAAISNNAMFRLHVAKDEASTNIPLVNLGKISQWLAGLHMEEALLQFDNIVSKRGRITFVNPDANETACTREFRFSKTGTTLLERNEDSSDRSDLLFTRREQIVSDWSSSNLLPDDFRWLFKATIPQVEVSFSKLENFLAIVSLVDHSTRSANGFVIRVKGHVTREQTLTWEQVPSRPDLTLRHLYQFCYRTGAGPLPDRLGIVRNLMTLYWDIGIFGIDLRIVAAARSAHELYLKRNLKEFVDLRAKVASFILEIDAKAAKAAETATGNLEKNFYGLATFVTSVVLLKTLQDKTFKGAFTPQLSDLGIALIGISLMHAIFACWSTHEEMKRAEVLYDDLRSQYSAFFTTADFDSIFSRSGKAPMIKTKDYLRSKLIAVMLVWALTLIVASTLIYILRS